MSSHALTLNNGAKTLKHLTRIFPQSLTRLITAVKIDDMIEKEKVLKNIPLKVIR